MATREQLLAVGPVDGRYAGRVAELAPTVSEFGLIKRRVAVSAGWLSMLGSGILSDRKPMHPMDREAVVRIADQFTLDDALEIKDIEKTTNHDVNAAVRWLKGRVQTFGGTAAQYAEMTHFGRTSEDINNLAYAMMVRDARDDVLLPNVDEIAQDLRTKAGEYADMPMLAHTHGQPAVTTTLGKEMAVFADRLAISRDNLASVAIYGKLNGATGNYSADHIAYPDVNWPVVAESFVKGLGFEFNPTTTQIEPHDWIVRFGNELALSNSIMIDLASDIWDYISRKYLKLEVVAGEDGSSAMPNKVNPIDDENAWSNFDGANDVLQGLSRKLPISRMQRDLSDSSTLRRLGSGFGHTVIGHKSLMKGLGKVTPNTDRLAADLDEEWGILAEPIQTLLRKHGVEGAYDLIKKEFRGMTVGEPDYLRAVAQLDVSAEVRMQLANLTPSKYTGYAEQLAQQASEHK
jgi:adenylosuccinate lyase